MFFFCWLVLLIYWYFYLCNFCDFIFFIELIQLKWSSLREFSDHSVPATMEVNLIWRLFLHFRFFSKLLKLTSKNIQTAFQITLIICKFPFFAWICKLYSVTCCTEINYSWKFQIKPVSLQKEKNCTHVIKSILIIQNFTKIKVKFI